MNLSQDEISALLSGNSPDEAEPVEIMSPDAIAAMLEESADADETAMPPDAAAADDMAPIEIMSPDAIAAMLDEAEASPDDDSEPADDAAAPGDSGAGPAEAVPAAVEKNEIVVPKGKDGMLTAEEIDILGEVGNISMGAVATTMYSLLDRRVSITTPRVTVYDAREVLNVYHIPFVVATIEYVEGITGNNLLVLKIEDAALITDLLMGGDGSIELPVELDEMHLSAMSEIMNQMMGASSTSLSKLLHTPINISPPRSSQVDVGFNVSSLLGEVELVTKISFDMEIEGLLSSELIQLVPYEESRRFAKRFMDMGMGVMPGEVEAKAITQVSPAAPAALAPPAPPPAPQPAAPAPPPPPPPQASAPPPAPAPDLSQQGGPYQQPYPQQAPYPPAPYQQAPYPPAAQAQPYPPAQYPYPPAASAPYPQPGRMVDVHPMQFQSFDAPSAPAEQKGIDLVYNIPLQVTVELGKTRKEISEILEFGTGTIIVLDKIAGDPVEIVVNGKLIARGEVVVIDENYGVRITSILNG